MIKLVKLLCKYSVDYQVRQAKSKNKKRYDSILKENGFDKDIKSFQKDYEKLKRDYNKMFGG